MYNNIINTKRLLINRKLEPFNPNEYEIEPLETNSNISTDKFEKNWNIENYANSQKFIR